MAIKLNFERKTGGSGFEPEQAEPKSAVLPLHHPPRMVAHNKASNRMYRIGHAWVKQSPAWQDAGSHARTSRAPIAHRPIYRPISNSNSHRHLPSLHPPNKKPGITCGRSRALERGVWNPFRSSCLRPWDRGGVVALCGERAAGPARRTPWCGARSTRHQEQPRLAPQLRHL